MRPLKSSSSSLEVKFKFVDGSMCVVCVYVCVHVHLEFRDVSDRSFPSHLQTFLLYPFGFIYIVVVSYYMFIQC